MSDCSLDIRVDATDYSPGDVVTGTVDLIAHDDCDCRNLTVTCRWYTHGRGDPATGSEQSIPLFSGSLHAGERHSYDFQFRLPNGPCTYHGHYLNVDWHVQAVADLSWLSKPEAQRPFRVVSELPSTEDPYRIGDFAQNPPASASARTAQESSTGMMILKIFFFCFFIGFCLLFVGAGIAMMVIGGDDVPLLMAVPFIAVPGLMAIPLLWMLWTKVLRNRFSTMKLGDLEVALAPWEVHAGDSFRVAVDIPPPSDVEMNQISVTLRAEERVRYRQGTNTRTVSRSLHEDERVIPDSTNRTIPDGEAAHFEYDLIIPPEAPPTFRARRNELNWHVDVHVDIADWPDWKKTLHLDVIPPAAAPSTPTDDEDVDGDFASEGDAIW